MLMLALVCSVSLQGGAQPDEYCRAQTANYAALLATLVVFLAKMCEEFREE